MKELLIVDDHHGIRILLKEVFNKEGYLVHLATNGAEAVRITERENIDCILLDMKVPDMSGIEMIKKLKEIKNNLPIIMMSGFSEHNVIQEALNHGALHYFTKPFNIHDVIEGVRNCLIIR